MSTSNTYQKIDAALILLDKPPLRDKVFPTFSDFFNYLGLRHFSLAEVTTNFKNADKCTNPIPRAQHWPHAALCLTLADRMRHVTDAPIAIKYAYRDEAFNKLVGGEPGSDHLTYALDLVFSNTNHFDRFAARDAALASVIEPLWRLNIVELSYGVGRAEPLIHVGVFCGRGQRRWRYEAGGPVKF